MQPGFEFLLDHLLLEWQWVSYCFETSLIPFLIVINGEVVEWIKRVSSIELSPRFFFPSNDAFCWIDIHE